MYIVTEIQINNDGTAGSLINNYEDLKQAQNKYYTILAAAAVSKVYKHAAFLFTEEGYIAHECFVHEDEEE